MVGIVMLIFLFLLALGMPVSFSLLSASIYYLTQKGISIDLAMQSMASSVGESFVLMAVPFFILAGAIMNNGGITQKIFGFANIAVGWVTGGLGHANILASIIFSGMSGTAIADAGGLGAIELEAMRKAGYDDEFSLAVTGASSIIGPIIPPSVPAVVYGVAGSVSIGGLFVGGIIPGLIMGGAMSIFVYIQSKKRGYPKRAIPTLSEFVKSLGQSFFALLTPVIIIGGIMTGVYTPTEAAVIAVAYALVLSLVSRDINVKDIPSFLKETADNTVSVMFIVACASVFGQVLTIERIPILITNLFVDHVSSKVAAILLLNLILLIVGTFMETISALTILTPVLLPVAVRFGMDPVHFGLVMILNLMIGLLTPPVGMVLYVLSSVSKVPFERIVQAVWPYIIVLTLVLLLLSFTPPLVLWLPSVLLK